MLQAGALLGGQGGEAHGLELDYGGRGRGREGAEALAWSEKTRGQGLGPLDGAAEGGVVLEFDPLLEGTGEGLSKSLDLLFLRGRRGTMPAASVKASMKSPNRT